MNDDVWYVPPELKAYQPPEWVMEAACANEDPEMFDVEHGNTQAAMRARIVCMDCPVAIECLTQAVDRREEFLVWGGATYPERTRLRREIKERPEHKDRIIAKYVASLRPRVAAWRKRKRKAAWRKRKRNKAA